MTFSLSKMLMSFSDWVAHLRGVHRYGRLFFCSVGICVMVQACSPSPQSETLRITGSSTIAPIMEEIVKQYKVYHPDAVIEVNTGGSSQGIKDTQQGDSDIGMVSRSLKPAEDNLETFTIAQDGISLLVHQSNLVSQLSKQQIVDIYTGKIRNWKAVGGNDKPIEVLSKTKNHATASLFASYHALAIDDIDADKLIGDNQEMLQAVLDNPDAIGYVSIGAAEYKIIHGTPLSLLPLEGVAATIQNVRNNAFPLSRPLNLVTLNSPVGEQKALIEFALSAEVKGIIQEKAFVPMSAL